ncbi:MAG: hypothetical protein J6X34_07740 [Clostridia bacterium]|nr:hypothetical protein [Clostridia bacterium]MBP5781109.1 hypothetical protein [Clostridia bacterium]
MAAERPANVKLKYKKFYQVRKLACKNVNEQMAFDMTTQMLGHILLKGDTQPAVVYSLNPFIVSAYSDELDAVVFLRFPEELAGIYDLSVGSRLVTACNYSREGNRAAFDIFPGAAASGLYSDVTPVVQLFFAGKNQILFAGGDDEIRARTADFSESVWARVNELTKDYAQKGLSRDGFFYMR